MCFHFIKNNKQKLNVFPSILFTLLILIQFNLVFFLLSFLWFLDVSGPKNSLLFLLLLFYLLLHLLFKPKNKVFLFFVIIPNSCYSWVKHEHVFDVSFVIFIILRSNFFFRAILFYDQSNEFVAKNFTYGLLLPSFSSSKFSNFCF